MKSAKKSLLLNSTTAFILAGLVVTTAHEAAHFLTAALLGVSARLYPSFVIPADSTTQQQVITIAAAGPLFSLLAGLLLIWLFRKPAKGFIRLLTLWLGFLSAQIGFGYFLIAPFVKSGDTGYVLSALNVHPSVYAVVFIIGALGTYFILPNLFGKLGSAYAQDKRMFFHLGMYPWLIGTSVLVGVYLITDAVIMHPESFDWLGLAATVTVGIFTPLANFGGAKAKALDLGLNVPVKPLLITIALVLLIMFGLSHGLQVGMGTFSQ